jgi:hypothetical protein
MRLDESAGAKKDTAPTTRVFTFEHAKHEDVWKKMRTMREFSDSKNSFQVAGNVLTVRAPQKILDELEVLVRELDQPPAPPRAMRVRVIWLLAGKADDARLESLAAPPEDLKPVLEELAELGIKSPKLATQMVLYGTAGSQNLQLNGSLKEPLHSQINVSGELFDKPAETPSLRLHIGVSGGLASGSLSTQISTPPGHFVVLGATPMESLTSVFVVQVTPRETTGDEKGNSTPEAPQRTKPANRR